MGFWDSLFGISRQNPSPAPMPQRGRPPTEDEYAVDRYRYLLHTAPPAEVERVHAEAFAKLTPEQRRILHEQLSAAVMVEERPADDRPETLARAATRAELRAPGTMERALEETGPLGFQGSMLGTIAGYVVASTIMHSFLSPADFGSGQDFAADAPDGDFGGGFGDGFGGGFDGGGFGDFGF